MMVVVVEVESKRGLVVSYCGKNFLDLKIRILVASLPQLLHSVAGRSNACTVQYIHDNYAQMNCMKCVHIWNQRLGLQNTQFALPHT